MYFVSSPGGFLPPIIFAIVLLHVQPILSHIAPIQMSEIPTQGISSRFRNFQQQTQHLTTLTNGTGRSNEINRRLASVLKRQSIFASLFDRSGGAVSGDILDLIFENVTEPHCEEHFRYALEQVFKSSTGIPDTWVLQMFDAFGKIPSGILSGHTSEPGDFHECVQIVGEYTSSGSKEKQVIRGRYCSTYLFPGPGLENLLTPPGQNSSEPLSPGLRESASLEELIALMLDLTTLPLMLPMMGTCFPDSCSAEDAQNILSSFHKYISQDFISQAVVASYVGDKPDLDAGDIAMIIVLVFFGGLCITGTILDLSLAKANKPLHQSLPVRMILAFSFYTNTQKFLSTKGGSGNLGCLHGLRFLSLAWVVLCHTFIMLMTQLTWNIVDAKAMYKDWSLYPILNGTPSVDTFFTLSGTLVAYNLLKELDKKKGRLNYILFVVHRYLRLTPTYLIIMGIMATLLPYTGTGPMWSSIDTESRNCGKYWWHNALYVNNLVKYDATGGCYGEAWYLANDMQFYLLSPLVIYPLWRWKKIGLGLVGILTVVSVAVPAYIVDHKDLPPTVVTSLPMKTYAEDVYKTPWTRFGPYVVGLLLGYLLHLRGNNLGKFRSIPKWIVLTGWSLSTVFALTIIYSGIYYFDPKNSKETFTSFHAAAYAGLERTIWGFCIAWIIFACVSGYGGWVNKILSLKIFMPLGRLTFCMYVTSYHIQLIYHLSLPHPQHYSKYSMVNLYFAHMVMSGLVAYVLTMSLESPFIQLEKMLFASQVSPAAPVKKPLSSGDINANSFDVKIDKRDGN